MRDYTTTQMIANVRLLPCMPSVQALFSDADIMSLLTLEMKSKLYPMIDNQTEEYFVYNVDSLYNPAVTTYAIPSRTLGGKIRSLSFVDPNSNEIQIPRLRPEDIMSKVNATGLAINPALWGFYVRNNTVVLYLSSVNGATSNYMFLRFRMIRIPNDLVATTACAQVSIISGNTVTVTNVPSTFGTTETYDFISNVPNFDSLGDDIVCTNISSLTMTFSAVPVTLAVGDWICLSGQAPVAQIPYAPGYDLLEQLAAAKCLEIHGDTQGFNVAMSQAATMKDYFVSLLTPRVTGNTTVLTSTGSIYGWDIKRCEIIEGFEDKRFWLRRHILGRDKFLDI